MIPICEALVDQGRFIGNDPVGHTCTNDATVIGTPQGHIVCRLCWEMLHNQPERITFHAHAMGVQGQVAVMEKIKQDMLRVTK